jgi:hypothetical protein
MKLSNFLRRYLAGLVAAAFLILPLQNAWAAAYVTLGSFSGTPDLIEVSGGGWQAGETVSIYLGSVSGSPAGSATAGTDSFFGPLSINIPPNTPQGPLAIIAQGLSGQTAENSFYVVNFNPSISFDSGGNTPGSQAMISGLGFASGEVVNFSLNGQPGGSVSADSTGSFSNGVFNVPSVPSGTYQLIAQGQASGAQAIFYFYVGGFYPSAYPSTYYLLPGESLSFSGSGFAAGEEITVTETNAGEVSTLTADSGGSFGDAGSFVVTSSMSGGINTFNLSGSLGNSVNGIMVTVGSFSGQIFPSSYFVPAGGSVTFSGNNFAPNEIVDVVSEGSSSPLTSFPAGSDGSFSGAGSVELPFSAAGTTRTFTLTGRESGSGGSVRIGVGSLNSVITPSHYYLNPGQSFEISGSGFGEDEAIEITAGSSVRSVSAVMGGFGPVEFDAPFTSGGLDISAVGLESGSQAVLSLTIGQLYPQAEPDKYYVFPGDTVTFTGSGFIGGESISHTASGIFAGSVASDPSGGFELGFSVPFGTNGSQTHIFTGSLSGGVASVTVTVATLAPYASADVYYATPGSTVNVSAVGFASGETVNITGGQTLLSVIAEGGVVPPTPVVLPFSSQSSVEITLTGEDSGALASVPITLAPFFPQVSPSTYYTNPGTIVSFSGSGFASGETVMAMLNGQSKGSVSANSSGEFSEFDIVIPVEATSANFLFTGEQSSGTANLSIALAPFMPQVSPSTWYAPAGSKVTLAGTGFASGESINISLNGSEVAMATVDTSGEFVSSEITLPFSATQANFVVTSSQTDANIPLSITVAALNPGLQLSTYYSPGGQPLVVSGQGFGGSETIDLSFDGNVLGNATTNTSGDFTWSGTVPFSAAGNKTIQARGQLSGAQAAAVITIPQTYVNVQLGAYAGAPGSAVNFIGSGFAPNEAVNITTNRTGSVVVHNFTANSSGSFNDSGYLLPSDFTPGTLTLTIIGQNSFSSQSIVYYVTGG